MRGSSRVAQRSSYRSSMRAQTFHNSHFDEMSSSPLSSRASVQRSTFTSRLPDTRPGDRTLPGVYPSLTGRSSDVASRFPSSQSSARMSSSSRSSVRMPSSLDGFPALQRVDSEAVLVDAEEPIYQESGTSSTSQYSPVF